MAVQGRIVSSEPNSSNTRRWPGVDRLPGLFSSNYTLSVAAQGLVSGFHFGLNLVLLRLISPYEYGIFAFAFVLAMFAAAVNNALISTPLTVYTPIVKDSDERARQEAMFSTLNLALFLALVVAGALYAWWLGLRQDIAVGVTIFVAVYSARQFSRSFGYARLRPLVTATGDGAYVLSGGIIIAMLVYTGGRVPVGHILLALAAANLVAMLVERIRLHGRQKRWFTIANVSRYAHIWLQSRWALIGALTTLFLAQAHSVIITWVDGPTAYAPLAAGFVLFGPVRVALMTWQNMVKPELAMALENQQQQAVRTQIGRTSVLMGAAVIVLGIIMAIAWPLMYELLYAKQYADEPMAFIVMIWAVITFFAAIYNAPSAALQAMRDFRVLAMGSIYGAGISGLLVCLLLYLQKPEHTLFGILAAELFMSVYLTRLLLGRLKA
jgi:O-antigen/teichoic acid export membrane protein